MKKIKLITSLCSIGVIAATTPVIVNCSANNINKVNAYESWGTIEGFSLPDTLYAGHEYTSYVRLRSSSGLLSPAEFKVDGETSKWVNVTIRENKISIQPTMDALGKECVIVIGAYQDGMLIDKLVHITEPVKQCAIPYLIYDGKKYDLPDDIDPNLFTTFVQTDPAGGDWTRPDIPLNNGHVLQIRDNYQGWLKLTALSLPICKQVDKLKDYFLEDCKGLTYLDLSGLNSITRIASCFLSASDKLSYVKLPNKSPNLFKTNKYNFMRNVPTSCVIDCGQYLRAYQTISPWKDRGTQMIGYENLSIGALNWDTKTVYANIESISELKLLDSGAEKPMLPITWKIEDETDENLNAYIDNNYIIVNPSVQVRGKNCKLLISAYSPATGDLLARTAFYINIED